VKTIEDHQDQSIIDKTESPFLLVIQTILAEENLNPNDQNPKRSTLSNKPNKETQNK